MSSEERADFLARSVAALVAWVARHPWSVILVALVLTLGAVHLAYARLEYHTQRNDLISSDKPCQQRWQKYLDTFGDDDDMVIVVEGGNRERMSAALDAVAARVKDRPDLFDRVFHRVDLRHLRDRGLLYLPPEQLDAIRARLDQMEPLFGPTAPLAWRMLSVQSLFASAEGALNARAAGRELSAADRELLAQLPAVATSAADTLRDPAAYRNPWSLGSTNPEGERREGLDQPQYFFTPDGSLAMLTCRPRTAARSFTPAKEASGAMRAILAEVEPLYPDVRFGLTGLPVLETDEMVLSDEDSRRASWLALLGVALLYFFVYRSCRYPLLTISTLVIGTLWALGWATITIGHLNILSATFAVMLIGLGDYGVLWVARYDEARKRGEPVEEALRQTAKRVGPSIVTAAATTGLAFFAIMLADFKAVAELGWIAGSGMLFCAASCLILMPALLVLVEKRRAGGAGLLFPSNRRPAPTARPRTLPFPSAWFPGLANRPRLALALGAVLVAACGVFAFRLTYDHNLLNLQARGLDSVKWEHRLIDRAAGATWDAMSIAHSREEALALKAKYEALPEVGRVVEVASLLPADQERKLPVIRAIHTKLESLPPAGKMPASAGSSPSTVSKLAERVSALAASDTALSRAARRLAAAVEQSPNAAENLLAFDRRLSADLAAELHQLTSVSRPALVTLEDVPPELRERYVGANGEFLLRAFARDSLWDYAALERFTTAASAVDPEATGKSFRTLEGLRQMKRGFEHAALYALAAIVLVLMLDLRRFAELALGLFPLAVGVVLTLGAMGLCGVSLNPANMIALPLIVGVGVDNGVHVLHDYRNRARGLPFRLGAATGRGVLVAGLTTVLGFGTLITARHAGMASLGLALTLGVTFCMLSALVFLPAVLQLRDLRRASPPVVKTVRVVRPLAKAA
jgi:hopanoid biosynthesis associated RND transporter like protein HpnN